MQPLLPGPDHAPQEFRFVVKNPLRIGDLSYETVVVNNLAFCRAKENSFALELYTARVLSGAGVRPSRAVAITSPSFLPPRLALGRSSPPRFDPVRPEALV
jgi:hypothetical protein